MLGQVYYRDAFTIIDDRIEGMEKKLKIMSRIVVVEGAIIGGIIGTLLTVWIFKII